MGGGVGPGGRGAEGAGGAAEEEGAGAGGEGVRHRGAGVEHYHPPDVPGEAQRQEEEGPLQEEQAEAGQGQQLHQSALWWVETRTAAWLNRQEDPTAGSSCSRVFILHIGE